MNFLNFLFFHTPLFYMVQSLWRDEAFSYFMAKPGIFTIISNTANDFNPPLYYLLLHFWIYVVGHSDIGLRLLSFIFHIIGVYFAYRLGLKIGSKKFALFLSIFFFFNPMLLYYGFEMRMYSLYSLMTISSLYYFLDRNWGGYLIASVMGLYTQTFFILVPISYAVYLLLSKQQNRKILFNTLKPVLFFIPWLPVILSQFSRSNNSWLFPVDLQLVKSVLGNLFSGYEGTPGGWWLLTFLFSVIILIFMILSLRRNFKLGLLTVWPVFFILVPILGYSIVKRPIYVNRYLISLTVFEVVSIAIGIWNIPNKTIRYLSATLWFTFVFCFNLAIAPSHAKTDFRTAFLAINKLAQSDDFVYTKTPIAFLESAYYFKNPSNVYVYNPDRISIPNYIGITAVFPDVSSTKFPQNRKVFLIADDAKYEVIKSE